MPDQPAQPPLPAYRAAQEIELATRNRTPFSLLLLDLDHFKAINDGHGHDAGDRALQHVAGLLGQLTRGSATCSATAARSSWWCWLPPVSHRPR